MYVCPTFKLLVIYANLLINSPSSLVRNASRIQCLQLSTHKRTPQHIRHNLCRSGHLWSSVTGDVVDRVASDIFDTERCATHINQID